MLPALATVLFEGTRTTEYDVSDDLIVATSMELNGCAST
jgi:hypothetical protein